MKSADEIKEDVLREKGKGMEGAPRAWTKEEVREKLVKNLIGMADYWAEVQESSVQENCRGLAFSILAMLDGSNINLPAFDLVPAPHPDDMQYAIDNECNYYVEEAINDDTQLHDMFHPMCQEIDANESLVGRGNGGYITAACGKGIADRINNPKMWEILRERMSTIQASGEEYNKKREAILGKVALNYLLCGSALEWDYLALLRENFDGHCPDLTKKFAISIKTAISIKLHKSTNGIESPSSVEEQRIDDILKEFANELKIRLDNYFRSHDGGNYGGTVMDLVEYLMQDTNEWVALLNYDYLIFKDTKDE